MSIFHISLDMRHGYTYFFTHMEPVIGHYKANYTFMRTLTSPLAR